VFLNFQNLLKIKFWLYCKTRPVCTRKLLPGFLLPPQCATQPVHHSTTKAHLHHLKKRQPNGLPLKIEWDVPLPCGNIAQQQPYKALGQEKQKAPDADAFEPRQQFGRVH
jgi:hypothetical protein